MRKAFGLRAQIIVNVSLLLGAALLFAGFLLLRLTEGELVEQRIASVTGTLEILSGALTATLGENPPTPRELVATVAPLFEKWPSASPLEGWAIVDRDLAPLSSPGFQGALSLDMADLAGARESGASEVQVHYPLLGLPHASGGEGFVRVTVPLVADGEFSGALQARFSLADVRQRVASAQKLVLLYVVLYGSVMVAFGVYLLSRTVVRPVKRLRELTALVAAGDLERSLPVEGPREIADLAVSFNAMTAALRESRMETETHILSLQQSHADLEKAQDDLVRSEKMASVGHLAAGMAHEIGNPLGAVTGYLELLKVELPPGRERDLARRSLAETERIDRLVRDLLDYAAPGASEPELFDPGRALAEARDLLGHQGRFEGVRIEESLPPAMPEVRAVRHKLLQVFLNLLVNAGDASSQGGTIRLAGGEGEESLWLSVGDEGEGIPPEVLPHIFDPFYTTKAPGKGRGLGLAVCLRVLEEAGGRIEVASTPGEGSVFTVWLPKTSVTSDEFKG